MFGFNSLQRNAALGSLVTTMQCLNEPMGRLPKIAFQHFDSFRRNANTALLKGVSRDELVHLLDSNWSSHYDSRTKETLLALINMCAAVHNDQKAIADQWLEVFQQKFDLTFNKNH